MQKFGAIMNLFEDGFKKYLEVFHSTLESTAKEFLKNELQKEVLHISLLPADITGYLSTQYGIAIEYEPSDKTIISVKRGSARVEDLLVKAPRSLREMAPFVKNSSTNTLFHSCSFSGKFPFRLEGADASLFLYKVDFMAQNWKQYVHFAEIYANRSKKFWSIENAVSRAKDEVLSALVESNRAAERSVSIDEYISKYKKKTVLVLGDYGKEGLKRLNMILGVLSDIGYEPLLLKNIPDSVYQDLSQKVVAIGSIVRFIVVDDSSKSGHLTEINICKQNNWVTILLRVEGGNSSWMSAGISQHSRDMLEKSYSLSDAKPAISEAVVWAENKLNELKSRFADIYPWRIQSANQANSADAKSRAAD